MAMINMRIVATIILTFRTRSGLNHPSDQSKARKQATKETRRIPVQGKLSIRLQTLGVESCNFTITSKECQTFEVVNGNWNVPIKHTLHKDGHHLSRIDWEIIVGHCAQDVGVDI